MGELLRAGFARLWRAPLLWLGMAVMACWGLQVCHGLRGEVHMDDLLQAHNLVTVFLPPVFCAMFLGAEHENGTIRNKLIAGKSRAAVYLSSLILSCAACLLMLAAYFLPVAIWGPFLTEPLTRPLGTVALEIGGSVLTAMAITGLCTLGSMLITRRAVLAVVLLLAVLGLLVAGATLENWLAEPEYYPAVITMQENGELAELPDVPNPYFLTGTKRAICQFLSDFLPTGQAVQYNFGNVVHPVALCLYSLFILAASTAGGLAAFRRKDLK